MKATFLGHQSWLINFNQTNILIDPVLYDSFGSEDDNSIEIYPPRIIDIENMPKIDAIILSHEHSDHFHIPTLRKFKDALIIVSPLMVNCISNTIISNNLQLEIASFQEVYKIKDLEIILYPADKETVFWESRVAQILIRSMNNSVFIAVDALVSESFKDDILNEVIKLPDVIVVSNNSQLTPKNVLGSLDNFKDFKQLNKREITGLAVLKELLVTYLEDLEEIRNIVICGGGFTKKYDTYFGPFPLSEQNRLAEIANYFSINKKILGPLPGQIIDISNDFNYQGSEKWVRLNHERLREIYEAGKKFNDHPINIDIRPVFINELMINNNVLNLELDKLAKAFMLSKIGNLAIDFLSSKTFNILPYGLALKMYDKHDFTSLKYYILNFNTGKFELVDADTNEEEIPFGIELFFNDFIGIITGNIQIWDLGGIGIKSWYIGEKINSPVGFLYSYFGEQVQSDLNYACFKKRWVIK